MNVLVTGAFGRAALAIVGALQEAGHEIIGLDLSGVSCPEQTRALLKETRLCSIEDFEQVGLAMRDVEAVVHLAVAGGEGAYGHPDAPFGVNVKGTYNVFEASRRNAVRKIIHMSSAAVHVPLAKGDLIAAEGDWRSSTDGSPLYDLTKRLQEEIAKDYCETHGMNAVVLRAGHIVDGRRETDLKGRPLSTLDYCRGGWVCRYDLANACLKALESRKEGYHAYHVVGSDGARRRFDIDRTETELGVVFCCRFEQYE